MKEFVEKYRYIYIITRDKRAGAENAMQLLEAPL